MSSQKKATVISTTSATLLLLIKLTIGIASGSVAVLASAIDSLLDTLVSTLNFFAIKKFTSKGGIFKHVIITLSIKTFFY